MSMDRKTSCGSGRVETDSPNKKPLHTLNIYSSNYGMCMGQVFIDKVN